MARKWSKTRAQSKLLKRGPGWSRALGLTLPLCVATASICSLVPEEAQAQMQLGTIQGIIRNESNGRPLAGVTVVVSGPSLQGDQTEFTDADGRYMINQLPPGDNYVVRFYFNDVVVEQQGIRLSSGKSLTISRPIPTQKGDRKAYIIREKAPNVDQSSSSVGVEINQEVLQNTAVRGRTYESVLSLAPGAADVAPRGVAGGDVGVSFSGSSGNENNFLIDGLNTTDPNLGLIATQLHPNFIKEVNVYNGGYQAEFGRATGGVVQVVTKTGSNEFHGSVFGAWAPFQLTPKTVARLGEAIGVRTRQAQQYDFGFELGGPLVKDRIWFYVGFAPTFTTTAAERVLRKQIYDPTLGGAKIISDFECPSYLSDPQLCDGSRVLARETQEFRSTEYLRQQRLYNGIAKLQFNLSPDHNITLGYIASPQTFEGVGGLARQVETGAFSEIQQIHDVTARYIGKFLDRKLQIDVMYGYHYQGTAQTPDYASDPSVLYRASPADPLSLHDFENIADCQRSMQMGPRGSVSFNPCPITSYTHRGFGQYSDQVLQRHVVLASATYFLRALGSHAIKAGFDFEDNLNTNTRAYSGTDYDPNDSTSGHRIYRTNAAGTRLQIIREYFTRNDNGEYITLNSFTGKTETRNYSWYLRDSWALSFVPGLLINAGLRWEIQEVFAQDGTRPVFLWDNIAPRVGFTYDWTRKGRSKLYFNYGRFYQSIPMDMNDRQFTGEGLQNTATTGNCPNNKLNPGADRAVPVPNSVSGAPCTFGALTHNGGYYGSVSPDLKGQFLDEIVVGYQHDVGLDIVLGVGYTFRELGNIVEDMSIDGGNFYMISNPGRAADPVVAERLDREAADLQAQCDAGMDEKICTQAGDAQGKATAYRSIPNVFPKAKRTYHALLLTAQKRLSNRFSLLANYTFSRVYGNYPGTFSPSNGQNDPNISSQFDLSDLLANRNGPLPTDRPHNFKFTGFYTQPIGQNGTLIASLTFTAISGRPINALGFHPYYGAREVFLLPQGQAGRTPTVTQFDMHLGYEHQLSKMVRMSVFWDVINLFNQREVVNVDDEYTASVVAPIIGGRVEDLAKLRDNSGALPVVNSNFGQPTAFQAPLYMRFGAKLSF